MSRPSPLFLRYLGFRHCWQVTSQLAALHVSIPWLRCVTSRRLMMIGILHDLRYAVRQLSKNPGFAATAVLTLALGIGANVAVFSVMNAILLNPSGIPHPERVVALRTHYAVGDLDNISFSSMDFGDAVSAKDIFTSAAVLMGGDFNYSGDGTTPEKLSGAMVSWQWF